MLPDQPQITRDQRIKCHQEVKITTLLSCHWIMTKLKIWDLTLKNLVLKILKRTEWIFKRKVIYIQELQTFKVKEDLNLPMSCQNQDKAKEVKAKRNSTAWLRKLKCSLKRFSHVLLIVEIQEEWHQVELLKIQNLDLALDHRFKVVLHHLDKEQSMAHLQSNHILQLLLKVLDKKTTTPLVSNKFMLQTMNHCLLRTNNNKCLLIWWLVKNKVQ